MYDETAFIFYQHEELINQYLPLFSASRQKANL